MEQPVSCSSISLAKFQKNVTPQKTFTDKNLRLLWSTIQLEKEMGKGLGAGQILFAPVSSGWKCETSTK